MKLELPGYCSVKLAEPWRDGATNVVDGFYYDFSGFEPLSGGFPATLTVSLPDDFDPRPAVIKDIEEQKSKFMAEVQTRLNYFDDMISKLQAISYTEEK